ncbi:MAG: sporulation protein YqfD [Bacillota bacterium]
MITSIIRYFRGYLNIEIKGNALTRFINQMTDIGIVIWDLKRITDNHYLAKIYKKDFLKIRELLRKRKCSVKILTKRGIPFCLWKIRRRVFFLIGIILFFLIFYIGSSLLLSIEIVGLNRLNEQEILNALKNQGIKKVVFKDTVDTSEIEKILIKKFIEIAWVDAKWSGTKLEIEVIEKRIVEDIQYNEIVADKDGVIKELIVLKGLPVVSEGDTVREGQLIILADNDNQDARGIVKADVWYDATALVQLSNESLLKTGRSKSFYGIKIGSNSYFLPETKQRYKNYLRKHLTKKIFRWRNITLPIELLKEEYHEINLIIENRSHELASFLAKEKALSQILKNLDSDAKIISIDFEKILNEKDKNIQVRVIVKVEENIAREQE